MNNIYMVQPNSQYGNSIYFPYAAGCLVAYAFENEDIRNNYKFCGFIYRKDDINTAFEKIIDPFFVGFSCYVWNYEYNKTLARMIKEKYPECHIAFGGHQVCETSDVVGADYVDYINLGEGEEGFLKLLLCLIGKGNLSEVPNLIYTENGEVKRTKVECTQIVERVSPYLKGYFDSLVENEPLEFSAILETNRGCPNRCAFCDWGNIKSKIKLFEYDTVKAEIDWFSDKKIEYVYAADSNYGMFERDEEFIDYFIEKHVTTGYPFKFQATYAKNNPERVFKINKKLNDAGMSKGATISFQSMSENVLDNIYRKNMPLKSFTDLMSLYTNNGIHAYSEIILSLPGESYKSFSDGVDSLLECGQHQSINFFNCELLANSGMNKPEYLKEYGIKTTRIEQHQYHVHPSVTDVKEFSDIVTSTNSLSQQDWVNMNILSVYVRTFHNLGLLQCFAIYLYYEKGVKYSDFYKAYIEFSKKKENVVTNRLYSMLYDKYMEILTGDGSLSCYFEEFGDITWPMEEGTFLLAIKDYDGYYKEAENFLKSYFDGDEKLFAELLAYQKAIVKNPRSEVITLKLDYDFPKYYGNVYSNTHKNLEKCNMTISIDKRDMPTDCKEFAEKIVWYGRKGGQNIITEYTIIK